jgi:hypothetical protein
MSKEYRQFTGSAMKRLTELNSLLYYACPPGCANGSSQHVCAARILSSNKLHTFLIIPVRNT